MIAFLRNSVRPLLSKRSREWLGNLVRPRVSKTAVLNRRSDISLGSETFIDRFCIFQTDGGKISIGNNSYIGPYSVIYANGGVIIGNDVMVAPHTMFASGNHDFRNLDMPMRALPMVSKGPIIVEDDVWIGAHCLICDNVTIAKGCVIGGGSVVTRSTKSYGIYAGVPAKQIGSRRTEPSS